MIRSSAIAIALGAVLSLAPRVAEALPLGVEVWTDRGNEEVYQPGDPMTVKVRTSDDAWLLVYEIDTEGTVTVLHPHRGRVGMVEGEQVLLVPDPEADVELVVQESVGQSYIVAIASLQPFRPLPSYLRPYSAQEEALGYVGEPDNEEGITAEGRIVGDPFVAMERIRRRVLEDPNDDQSFATSYTTYYVHTEVRYPRYLCYDCHRPDQWSWWDGFDPYYTDCSVFSFRVNWSWYWGPSYWYGHVPYYVYVYRPDCPPPYLRYFESGIWYSAWDGWNRWCDMWGPQGLRRYKSPPPANYIPPTRWKDVAVRLPAQRRDPPGFIPTTPRVRSRDGVGSRLPMGRSRTALREGGAGRTPRIGRTLGTTILKPGVQRTPAGKTAPGVARERGDKGTAPGYRPKEESRPGTKDTGAARKGQAKPMPAAQPKGERRDSRVAGDLREWGRREPEWSAPADPVVVRAPEWRAPDRPAPEYRPPQQEAPRMEAPRMEPPRVERPRVEAPRGEAPRVEAPRVEAPPPAPRAEPAREGKGAFPARRDKR